MKFSIDTSDKPNLEKLMKEDKSKAGEVIKAFAELMEEAVSGEWYKLPQSFHKDLTFSDLVKGILHGSLDLKGINPAYYDVMKEEVHPLSMLSPRANPLNEGEMRYYNWRNHYRLPEGSEVNRHTIEQIFRKSLRYYKYVDVEALAGALSTNQIKVFEGLGKRAVQNLPFYPALRYQQEKFGDLHVGMMFDDIGAFDCGVFVHEEEDCPACKLPTIHEIGNYLVCLSCNAGFKEESE